MAEPRSRASGARSRSARSGRRAALDQLYDALYKLHEEVLTLLLAEQSIPLALAIADYAYVLQTGRTVLEGTAEALENNAQVQEIYLGIKTGSNIE